MKMIAAVAAAFIGIVAVSGSAMAGHKRHVPPHGHPSHAACERAGWNHPSCAHLQHYGSSSQYYQHHDPRHSHGMALD